MSMQETKEDIERKARPWVPRVLQGGKGPPEEPTDNWLKDFEVGTTFVARHRNSKDVDYNLYYVMFKSLPEVVLLKWQLPDGKVLDYYVDPERFSKMFDKHVILSVIRPADITTVEDGLSKQEELQKEAEVSEDGNTDRPD